MIIGLTGKICAGKDTLASMLPADRFSVIDVDRLGHEALSENVCAIRHAFGDSVIKADGSVDRKVLGPMVFADKEKLETLNSITHPWMVERALGMARDAEEKGRIAVINAALLESMGFVPHCDKIILVTAPYEVRERRAWLRSGLDKDEFRKRSEAQKEIGMTLFSFGRPVITIINGGDEDSLSRQVSFLCDTI